jgi:hypothetical protein
MLGKKKLSLALFCVAFAACGLPADIDPNGECVTDANGWSTLDADSDASIPISLVISTKAATTDAFTHVHGATAGTLTDKTADDGRYILSCPQTAGGKTVKMIVSRPASLTAFGAEWVQLFPKDSWANTTNEYEPFTFNEYGAKIPLPEFRPTTNGLANDAADENELNVFMEVKDEGDYEVMFGNPSLVSGGKWVAVQFRQTLLRVGTPWADCSGSTLAEASVTVGMIMPVLFGGPNLNSISLAAGNPNYLDVISELSGVSVPVRVVLEVFNSDKTSYTDSATNLQCYKAGNACPEAHLVCEPSYCEMDVWKALIADFKAAGTVHVLGSVGSGTTTSQYSDLDMDGFYFTDGVEAGLNTRYISVHALGSPLFDETALDDATTYVTLASPDLGVWNPFSWYPYVSPSKWAAIVTHAADVSTVSDLVDRGYGWVYLTSAGLDTKSSLTPSLISTIEGLTTDPDAPAWGLLPFFGSFSSIGLNNPADEYQIPPHEIGKVIDGDLDTWSWTTRNDLQGEQTMTLTMSSTASLLGVRITNHCCTGWFPLKVRFEINGAKISGLTSKEGLEIHSQDAYWHVDPYHKDPQAKEFLWPGVETDSLTIKFDNDRSGIFFKLKEIEPLLSGDRRLQAAEAFWGCDDTLLACQPICMKKTGVVTTKVSDKLCSAAPMDQCACKCYHEAQWACEDNAVENKTVVCKARYGASELKTVGDKVCEIRGAPKPASTAELRIASNCEPMTEMRGSAPTAECLAQWGTTTPKPVTAAEQAAAKAETPEAQNSPDYVSLLDESFAAACAFAAFVLQA